MLGRLLYVEPIPALIIHTCMKHSSQISIHINVYPCGGIRDLGEDFPGLQRREERWELNMRSNGGYNSLSPSSSSLCQLSRKLGYNASVDAHG